MIFWGRLGGCVRLVKRDRSLFAFCMKRALTGRHLSQKLSLDEWKQLKYA